MPLSKYLLYCHATVIIVPDAKRRISLFGNELLPDFYESFKVRAGSNVQLMKRMFIAERDRQYNITVDIEQLENRFQYLSSDNPDFSVMTTVISEMKSSLSFKPSKITYQNTTTASSLKTLVNSKLD